MAATALSCWSLSVFSGCTQECSSEDVLPAVSQSFSSSVLHTVRRWQRGSQQR